MDYLINFVNSTRSHFPPFFHFSLITTTSPSHIHFPFPVIKLITIKQFVWIGLHEYDTLSRHIAEPNLFHIFKSCHVCLFKRLFSNQSRMQDEFFSVEVAMAEETKVELIGTKAQEGSGYSYILMLIHKISANCFMGDFSIRLGRE